MRRLWIAGPVLVLVLVAAHLTVWFIAAGRMEREEQLWVAARQAQGWTVTTGEIERHGWPFSVALHVPALVISSPASGGLTYDAQTVELRVSLFNPYRLMASFFGSQHLRMAGLPTLSFIADRMSADIALASGGAGREGDLSVTALRFDVPGAGTTTVAKLMLHGAWPMDTQTAAFQLDASAIYLPVGVSEAFDQGIGHVILDGTLAGPPPRLPLSAPSLAAWRDGGGALTLKQVEIDWSRVTLKGSATLALDAKLQPRGTAQVRITGQDEAVDALAKDGVITARTAIAAKGILGLLSRPAEGGTRVVEVPLTLQDRGLQLGQIPLLRLPEIVWKGAS